MNPDGCSCNEPRERTEDWIPKGYVQDEPFDLNPEAVFHDRLTENPEKCLHGSWIWEHKKSGWECFFCGKPKELIVTQEEYEWLLSLCTRQG